MVSFHWLGEINSGGVVDLWVTLQMHEGETVKFVVRCGFLGCQRDVRISILVLLINPSIVVCVSDLCDEHCLLMS